MLAITDALRECHRLRRHLRDLQAEIDRGPRVLQGQQETLEAARQAHKDHHDSITKLKVKQRTDETSLKEVETRLAKLEQQLLGISVAKEITAKQSEIKQAQAKKDELEESILTTIAEIEKRTNEIPAVEKTWADAQAAFKEFEKEAAERLERLKADQESSLATLKETETKIPSAMKPKYDTLVKAHGPEAMVAAKARVCQGCRRSLTEQKWTEVRNGAFYLCPHCGKIMYPIVE
ncbi:MAG: hypothetical protein C0467_11455 [Planctomycetaceae bacterium]|nr:hypothetical protein [Planctomycetaceae bacterium]